jgi:hypothetical protein
LEIINTLRRRHSGESVRSRPERDSPKARIQFIEDVLDPGFRRGDEQGGFYEIIRIGHSINQRRTKSWNGSIPSAEGNF